MTEIIISNKKNKNIRFVQCTRRSSVFEFSPKHNIISTSNFSKTVVYPIKIGLHIINSIYFIAKSQILTEDYFSALELKCKDDVRPVANA